MRNLALSLVAVFATAGLAGSANAVVTITNTGVAPLAWTVTGAGTPITAVKVTNLPSGWVANTAVSSWVSLNANGTGPNPATPNGNYTYSTSFTGNVGDVLSFRFWADDLVISMLVDGVLQPINAGTYTSSTPGSFVVASNQMNHSLSFTVQNNGSPAESNPTGFRFEAVTGAVPEPASWALMLAGFGLMGYSMRSSRRKVAVNFG